MTGHHKPAAAGLYGAQAETPVIGLRKTWVDPGPDISMVQILYTWAPDGGDPDWTNAEEKVLATEPGHPGLRSAILEVPRVVDGSTDYVLHHFFFVVTGSGRTSSPVFTEQVIAREVTFQDTTGDFTFVGISWSAAQPDPAPPVPNYTAMTMDGLPLRGADDAPELTHVYEFVHARPLPHIFRGLVWGIRGTHVDYVLHQVRGGSPDPGEDHEVWADDHGTPWSVDL